MKVIQDKLNTLEKKLVDEITSNETFSTLTLTQLESIDWNLPPAENRVGISIKRWGRLYMIDLFKLEN